MRFRKAFSAYVASSQEHYIIQHFELSGLEYIFPRVQKQICLFGGVCGRLPHFDTRLISFVPFLLHHYKSPRFLLIYLLAGYIAFFHVLVSSVVSKSHSTSKINNSCHCTPNVRTHQERLTVYQHYGFSVSASSVTRGCRYFPCP